MSKLAASLVVDLIDETGAKARSIIRDKDRLKRAERDYMLADRGMRLSNRDRAMERQRKADQRSPLSRNLYPIPDKALEGFMDFHGLVEAGNNASEKIEEGGNKTADTTKASAGQVGQAIGAAAADSILSRLRGSLGALLTNPGGGRPTGQIVREQANGRFVDP